MELTPIVIKSLPGIKRDNTRFNGDNYTDGQWCRFDEGLPRKMAGYRAINKYLLGRARALNEYTQDALTYIHAGSANLVERFYIDGSFNTSVVTNRTPVSDFTESDNNLWQFDIEQMDSDGTALIVAQVAPNLADISNSAGGELFYGDLTGTDALTAVSDLPDPYSATGGIVALHPYTVVFGNNGFVMWSVPGDPTDYMSSGAGFAYVTGQKIVRGLPLRSGTGSSPGALLWSNDSLIQMSYIGGTPTFSFDTLSSQSSILSAASVIEYDGIFYWLGVDRFLAFNGVVSDIENEYNRNFFFDNLNYAQRQKVFAFKVPRWGEIWWCYPSGSSDEPDRAVIFNVRKNIWYDTALPEGGRSAGIFPAVFRRPLMAGVEPGDYALSSADIDDGGTGYVAGDVLDIVGGQKSITAQFAVDTVDMSGVITAVTIVNAGRYQSPPDSPASVMGGSGTGATFTCDFEVSYKFWVHEVGLNKIDGSGEWPIESYFETSDLSLPVTKGQNRATHVEYIEPDFTQTGDMTVQVRGRANARAPEVNGPVMSFPAEAQTPVEQIIYLKEQRRELRFRFSSNVIGGFYQMGQPIAHVQPGDGTIRG